MRVPLGLKEGLAVLHCVKNVEGVQALGLAGVFEERRASMCASRGV
jgi:hypothetical protein